MLTVTTVFLFVVFAAAEFYRFRQRITGSIREILLMDGDPTGIAGVRLKVETSEAGEITAFISGCQMCMSRVEIGAMVSLIPGPNGYIVKSPWISGQRKGCPGSAGVSPALTKESKPPDGSYPSVAGEAPALPGKKPCGISHSSGFREMSL
jgi:hypothetical protein